MPIKVVTAPATLPVTLSEVKAFCNVSIDDDDTLLTSFMTAATNHAEHVTGLRLVSQTLDLYLDGFPAGNEAILLDPPVQSVTSVTYIDDDGDEQTFAAENYILDAVSEPARLALAYDAEWPDTRWIINAVVVRFVSGVAQADVPEEVKTYIKAFVLHLYDGRPGDPEALYSGMISTCRRVFAV